MTQRERSLLTILVVIGALVGGLFVVYQWFLAPMQDYDRTISRLLEEVDAKDAQHQAILEGKKDLARWRVIGLPSDPTLAELEYSRFVHELLAGSGLKIEDSHASSTQPKAGTSGLAKKPSYSSVNVDVKVRGDLSALTKALEKFHKTPLLHRVKKLTISQPESASAKEAARGLSAHLSLEALIVNGTQKRSSDLVGSEQQKYAMLGPSRPYGDVARKNIFQGAPPVAKERQVDPQEDRRILEHVVLDSITLADRETQRFRNHEAFLRIKYYKAPDIRLCPAGGFDRFRVRDEEGKRVLVEGQVLRIDSRDVYFRAKDSIYGIHMGQSLADAMRRALTAREVDALGLGDAKTKSAEKAGKVERTAESGGEAR